MNQIAAAILILSASITGYSAAMRPIGDNYGGVMTLIALGLGLWGSLALLTSTTQDRDYDDLGHDEYEPSRRRVLPPVSQLGRTVSRYTAAVPRPAPVAEDYGLSPEMNAQVSMAARRSGATRSDVVEDVLRHNLHRYSSSRVA
jgi:hypothetical protein